MGRGIGTPSRSYLWLLLWVFSSSWRPSSLKNNIETLNIQASIYEGKNLMENLTIRYQNFKDPTDCGEHKALLSLQNIWPRIAPLKLGDAPSSMLPLTRSPKSRLSPLGSTVSKSPPTIPPPVTPSPLSSIPSNTPLLSSLPSARSLVSKSPLSRMPSLGVSPSLYSNPIKSPPPTASLSPPTRSTFTSTHQEMSSPSKLPSCTDHVNHYLSENKHQWLAGYKLTREDPVFWEFIESCSACSTRRKRTCVGGNTASKYCDDANTVHVLYNDALCAARKMLLCYNDGTLALLDGCEFNSNPASGESCIDQYVEHCDFIVKTQVKHQTTLLVQSDRTTTTQVPTKQSLPVEHV